MIEPQRTAPAPFPSPRRRACARPRAILLWLALLSIMILGAAPVAAEPEGAPVSTVQANGAAARPTALWGYLSVLAVGLGMAGAWAWRRRRNARGSSPFDASPVALPLLPLPQQRTGGDVAGGRATPTSGIFAVKGLTEDRTDRLQPPPTPRLEAQRKECPRCRRQFGPTLMLCPFDHQPLQSMVIVARRAGGGRHGDTKLARGMCPGCGRRYEHGASFCLYDGTPLVVDTAEDAERAPAFRVCPSCGRDGGREGSATCAHDGAQLLVVDPGHDGEGAPPVLPVAFCPSCRHVGALGQAFCPHDGEVLIPRTHLQEQVFPHQGIGPERSLCKKCGRRYRGEARHCSSDGARLIDLN